MPQHRPKSRTSSDVSTDSNRNKSNEADVSKRKSHSGNRLERSMESASMSSSSETLSTGIIGAQITGGQPSSLLRGTNWRSQDSCKTLTVEPAEQQSATTPATTANATERQHTDLNPEFQENGCSGTNLPVLKLDSKSKESKNNSIDSVEGLSDQHLSSLESISTMTSSEQATVGVDTAAQLGGHLAAASEKLKFYYNNNFDKEHHECQDEFKALIDGLNEVFAKLHGLLQVSNLPILDEAVARRFYDAQQELIVLEDLVSQVKNIAERHGYSCGIKESLEEMAITLYCLRQMHDRQNVLIEEIVMARRENIELRKIIEIFRSRATQPVQMRIALSQTNGPEPSSVAQTTTAQEFPEAAAADCDDNPVLAEGHSEIDTKDTLTENLSSAHVSNIQESSVMMFLSAEEISGNTSNQKTVGTKSWTVHIDCSLFMAAVMLAFITVMLLKAMDEHRFVKYCCRYMLHSRYCLCQTCCSWLCTYKLACTFPWN